MLENSSHRFLNYGKNIYYQQTSAGEALFWGTYDSNLWIRV